MPLMKSSSVAKLNPLHNPMLSDEAVTTLRKAIINGVLPPGTRLVERDIAEQLGISRIPVREAIQQLADEGLVVKEPRRGAYVQPYSEEELEEIYSLRIVLERFVIERVMANWSLEVKGKLQAIVQAMRQAAATGNKLQVFQLDTEFHETLWALADHQLLLEVVSGLRTRITRLLSRANATLSAEQVSTHVESHQALLDILASGDVEAAKARITSHILGGKMRVKADDNPNNGSKNNGAF